MEHFYLILLAFFTGFIGLIGFFWAMKNGQFDDPEGNAARILKEDVEVVEKKG